MRAGTMNLRDLKYLITIAECSNFGKAAEKCYVSQPALSMQIKKLEETLGAKLFERNNKSISLTIAGKLVVERARNLLTLVDEMKDIAKKTSDPFSGELTLGVIPTIAPYILPHVIPAISETFPKLKLYLLEDQTVRLIDRLKQREIDCAILVSPIREPDFLIEPLFKEEFLLAVHPTHHFSKYKIMNASDLKNKEVLLLEEGHCMRDQTLEFCKKAKADEEKRFTATSLETLRHMVAANVGMTLMPQLACRAGDGTVYIPFKDPKPNRTAVMAWRKSTVKSTLLETITKQIKTLLVSKKLKLKSMNSLLASL